MIARLEKKLVNEIEIIYGYSFEAGPMDGLIKIDLPKGLADVTPAKGDERGMYAAKLAVGKIMSWNEEKKLPDKYTICTG